MSRGFVKEDDLEEAPFIPPRAPLPPGMPNHVTPRGLELLLHERAKLERERSAVGGTDEECRRTLAVLDGKLALVQQRIATARVVEPRSTPPAEVRFGGTVRLMHLAGPQQGRHLTIMLVGVDEANVKEGRIAFTSPMAKALLGKRVGEEASIHAGGATIRVRIEAIT